LPVLGDLLAEVDRRHPRLDPPRRQHETIRRLVDRMVRDLLGETARRLAETSPAEPSDVRAAGQPLVGFGSEMSACVSALRDFLHARMYRHYKVNRMALKARRIVRELVEVLTAAPDCLPDGWRQIAGEPDSRATAETVRDYIAGMTDRFALDEHDRLTRLGRDRL
jgi:dGTPase